MMTAGPELDWFKRWAQLSPRAIALRDGTNPSNHFFTYEAAYKLICQLAEELQHSGIGKDSRVAYKGGNSLELILLFFALRHVDACLIPLNSRWTDFEVDSVVKRCEPHLLFSETDLESLIEKASKREGAAASIPFAGRLNSVPLILYTSGTTGVPKGVMLSNEGILWNSITTGLRLNLTQNDRAVIFLPLFHTGAWNVLLTPLLHRGAELILLPKFDAPRVLQLCSSYECTILFGVPTTMGMMSETSEFQHSSLSTLRYAIVGGEPMPRPLIDLWQKRGILIRQGYGLSEFGPNVFSLNSEDCLDYPGSIGYPNFDVQVSVRDEGGLEIKAPDSIGELWLKGPMCMEGYFRDSTATEDVFSDGWLKTGDLVKFNEKGLFFVVGRKKDMYISGGENVYPAEIEAVLRSMTGIREVAVVPTPHPRWGEVGVCFYSVDSSVPKISVTSEELEAFAKERLAKFKVPQKFIECPELPKSDTGKILKKSLGIRLEELRTN